MHSRHRRRVRTQRHGVHFALDHNGRVLYAVQVDSMADLGVLDGERILIFEMFLHGL